MRGKQTSTQKLAEQDTCADVLRWEGAGCLRTYSKTLLAWAEYHKGSQVLRCARFCKSMSRVILNGRGNALECVGNFKAGKQHGETHALRSYPVSTRIQHSYYRYMYLLPINMMLAISF